MSAPKKTPVAAKSAPRRGAAGDGGVMRRASAAAPAWHEGGWVPVAVLAFATLVLFRAVLFGGMTFFSPDATSPLGFVRVGEKVLFEQGVYPLWNPFVFCGMPSFASLAYNPFLYPPDWPLWLITRVLPLPPLTWLVLYYFVGGLGAYLLAREWGAGRSAATIAGLVFLSMPNLIAVGAHGHGSQLVNSMLLPWLLWLAARVFRAGRLTDVAWLALVAGCQLLRGHVQICYYSWLAVGAYAVFEVARGGAGRPPFAARAVRLAFVGGALAVGLALASFLYLPVQEYAKFSQRGGGEGGGVGMDYATQWSFHPIELLTFFVPGAVGFGGPTYWGLQPITDYPHYMGLGVLGLALVGLARARRAIVVAFLGALATAGVLIAFGRHGYLYQFLYDHLPQFNKFRVPVMILLLTQLSTAILAALGVQAVLDARDGDARRRVPYALLGAIALAALVLFAGLVPESWQEMLAARARALRPNLPAENLQAALAGAAADARRVGALALVALMAGWLCLRHTIPAIGFVAAVAVTALIDLWAVDARILAPVLAPEQQAAAAHAPDDVITFLMARGDSARFRVLPVQDFQSNRYAEYEISSVGGYHAAKPKLAQDYIVRQAHFAPFQNLLERGAWSGDGFLNAANVEYVLVPGALPPGSPLVPAFQGAQMVYRNPNALPRVSLATQVEVVPGERQLDRLLEPGFDPRAAVLLERAPDEALGPPGGTALITRYGLNEVVMEVDVPGPAVLRFAELYFPGWRARVDGRLVAVLRADHCFRAILLPEGRHRVEWTYESDGLRLGLYVTAGAVLLLVVLFALGARQPRAA